MPYDFIFLRSIILSDEFVSGGLELAKALNTLIWVTENPNGAQNMIYEISADKILI